MKRVYDLDAAWVRYFIVGSSRATFNGCLDAVLKETFTPVLGPEFGALCLSCPISRVSNKFEGNCEVMGACNAFRYVFVGRGTNPWDELCACRSI